MGVALNGSLVRRLVGEFGVIVLGVLVALGVDDWEEGRRDRALERSLLGRMEAELLVDGVDPSTLRPSLSMCSGTALSSICPTLPTAR